MLGMNWSPGANHQIAHKRPTPRDTATEGCVKRCLNSSTRDAPLDSTMGTAVTETGTYANFPERASRAFSPETGSRTDAKGYLKIPCARPELVQRIVRFAYRCPVAVTGPRRVRENSWRSDRHCARSFNPGVRNKTTPHMKYQKRNSGHLPRYLNQKNLECFFFHERASDGNLTTVNQKLSMLFTTSRNPSRPTGLVM